LFWEVPGELGEGYMPISALAVAPSDCDVIYAAKRLNYLDNEPSRVFKSTNGGATWTVITNNLVADLYITALTVNPLNSDHVVAVMAGFSAGEKVFQSLDGGQNWENISYNLGNFPVNAVKFVWESNSILIGTDAGVFLLREGQGTWEDQSNGLPNVIVSDIEINEAANKIYVSTFGRGIWSSDLNLLLSSGNEKPCQDQIEFAQLSERSWNVKVNNEICPKAEYQTLQIIDVMGRIVQTNSIQNNEVTFDLNQITSGVYFAHLSGKGASAVQKFYVK
jgi:hypothetical protein